VGLRPHACWDCGFEYHRGHGCLSVVSVVCCQVEVSASGWSLIQRSPTECVVSKKCDREASKTEAALAPKGGCRAIEKNCLKLYNNCMSFNLCFFASKYLKPNSSLQSYLYREYSITQIACTSTKNSLLPGNFQTFICSSYIIMS
jgi:hypothetical protein